MVNGHAASVQHRATQKKGKKRKRKENFHFPCCEFRPESQIVIVEREEVSLEKTLSRGLLSSLRCSRKDFQPWESLS